MSEKPFEKIFKHDKKLAELHFWNNLKHELFMSIITC